MVRVFNEVKLHLLNTYDNFSKCLHTKERKAIDIQKNNNNNFVVSANFIATSVQFGNKVLLDLEQIEMNGIVSDLSNWQIQHQRTK